MRKLKIKPKLLLNKQATRNNIINAWHKMVKQAQPGDTLILTYSGHGSQINDIHPLDEDGEKDETLSLYQGYITDDELTELFMQASEYKIIFLADSCHSGGLTRAIRQKFCRSRYSKYPQQGSLTPPPLRISTRGDEKETQTQPKLLISR